MLSLIALCSLSGLLAVWVIYPAVIAALAARAARRRPAARGPRTHRPAVTVVIATREDRAIIGRRIANCLQTSYDGTRLDVVVALDRDSRGVSPDESCSDDRRVTVMAGDEPGGKAATLNAAVRAARGELLVFADAHQLFEPDTIGQLVDALQEPNVGAVSGYLEIPDREGSRSLASRYWMYERWLRRSEAAVHSSVGVSGSIWAMRKSLWSPLPPLLILDDLYAPMRIVLDGYRVGFATAARAIETRTHDPAQEYHRKVRTLTGVVQLCRWMPRVLSPAHNPIWAQFVAHKILRLLTPYWVLAIGVWAGVMAGQALADSPRLAIALGLAGAVAIWNARSGALRSAWETLLSGTLLQAAAIVGTVNGLRGRWNVWAADVQMTEQK